MCTPFDGIIWKLENTSHSHPYPKPPTIIEPGTTQGQTALANLHPEHYPVGQTFDQVPLRSHTSFMLTIANDDCAEVKFLDPTPHNSKIIWAEAQNVYYDREFYAVRGELMYNKKTGEASPCTFGNHFVISYVGRMATGGFKRQVSIELYGEESIAIPTFDLLHCHCHCQPQPSVLYSKFGSWKADD